MIKLHPKEVRWLVMQRELVLESMKLLMNSQVRRGQPLTDYEKCCIMEKVIKKNPPSKFS